MNWTSRTSTLTVLNTEVPEFYTIGIEMNMQFASLGFGFLGLIMCAVSPTMPFIISQHNRNNHSVYHRY